MRSAFDRIRSSALAAFLGRTSSALRDRVHVLANPTEEILEEAKNGPRGKTKLMFAAGGARARLEENYLFDTRRFPTFTSAEATPYPLLSQDYVFFMNAIGGNAANNGFSPNTVPTMSSTETNMDTPGQVPQGKNFVMTQVGISFNVDAVAADAALMLEMGSIRFSKQGGQFTMHHGRPSFWASGMGLSTSLASGSPASNGIADIRAVRKLAVPRVLGQRDQFQYVYNVPRTFRNNLGFTSEGETSTAATLVDPVIMTIWLWGGQEDSIPT